MPRGAGWWTATVLCILGCAGPEQGAAQDTPPVADPPPAGQPQDQPAKKPREPDEEKQEEGRRYDVSVRERGQEQAFKLLDASLFVPEVSLFGGEGGRPSKLLRLKRGAAELTIPFRRIKKIDVLSEKEDRLEVVVQLVPGEGSQEAPAPINGTIKAGLELRGGYEKTSLKAVVKLREVLSLELEPAK